ncbi:MAG: xanthine dehydrogenase family protein molybdopterin-binding subunit [Chloroflexi bacterium]|nr:xanthine dehydrogenase family protein molybdopterin-binding subunit [Chloroflexota bacterium]
MTTYTTIGKPVPRLEGNDKVLGRARYVADLGLPGMLWGKALRSPYPHARILGIDASKARRIPGVHAVLTAQDIPDTRVGRRLRDMPVLARGRVRFIGEKVAAVAAEDPDVAEEALLAIEVEYQALPAVFDPLEAMQEGAPLLHEGLPGYQGLPGPMDKASNVVSHVTWSKGDVQEGFAQADHVFEHTLTCPFVHQAYLEPHACVVRIDEGGRVQVWANNKTPFLLRRQLAEGALLPEERIVVHPVPIGGDFGGKGSFMDVPLAYFLAGASRRPVKMVMSYIEELMAGNPRHPVVATLRSGVTRDGRIVARQVRMVFNSGAYAAFKPSPSVTLLGASHAAGPYSIPHARIDSYVVYTNCVPCGHFRAPGEPQAVFVAESHMDMVARELGLDPLEFRLRNLVREGDTSPTGEQWHHIRAEETLRAAAEAIGWGKPKDRPNVGRGIAMGERHVGIGQSNATLRLEPDGSLTLLTPVLDTGTGAHLILRQVVAEVLSVPVEQVSVVNVDTSAAPFDSGVGGSRVTFVAGQTALRAAQQLRQKLAALAAERLGCQESEVQLAEGAFQARGRRLTLAQVAAGAPLEATSVFVEFSATQFAEVTGFTAQAAEVEVDPDTGQVQVRCIVSANDVGTVLNPIAHQGQIEGGVIQGLGYALMEELRVSEGRVSTLTFGEYKIPTMKDVPPLTTVLLESPTGPGPFQGKAIGEHAISPIAPAIANALFDAIGVRIADLPITAEKVYSALQEKRHGGG